MVAPTRLVLSCSWTFRRGRIRACRDDLQVVEVEVAAVEAFADDGEDIAAFDGVAGGVGHGVGKAILALL